MGWEVRLAIYLEQKHDPVKLFTDLLEALSIDGRYSPLYYLFIASRSDPKQDNKVIEKLEEPTYEVGIPAEVVQQVLNKYAGDDLTVKSWCAVLPRYSIDDLTGAPYERGGRAGFSTMGQNYYLPGRFSGVDIIYEIGSSRDYEPSRRKDYRPSSWGEAARLNINALVQEIPFLVDFGAETIQGIGPDLEYDPRTFFLCYHRNLTSFEADLAEIEGSASKSRSLTPDDLLSAAFECSNTEIVEIAGGFLAYHQNLVEGNLKKFYQKLIKVSQNDP